MHYNDWKNAKKLGIKIDFKYYNMSHQLMKQFNEFNKLTNESLKTEVHHLRYTEEQREYNNKHYELWGFNEDGTFEYGKYVIFVTHKEHTLIHSDSKETREKKRLAQIKRFSSPEERERASNAGKGRIVTEETKQKISAANKGHRHSDETKAILREKCSGWHHTEESKQKISDAGKGAIFSSERCSNISNALKDKYASGWNPNKGREVSEETRKKIGDANRGENNGQFGKHHSDETKRKISESNKASWTNERRIQQSIKSRNKVLSDETKSSISKTKQLKASLYNRYKLLGGLLKWNTFNKYFKEIYDENTNTFNTGFMV